MAKRAYALWFLYKATSFGKGISRFADEPTTTQLPAEDTSIVARAVAAISTGFVAVLSSADGIVGVAEADRVLPCAFDPKVCGK